MTLSRCAVEKVTVDAESGGVSAVGGVMRPLLGLPAGVRYDTRVLVDDWDGLRECVCGVEVPEGACVPKELFSNEPGMSKGEGL